jgi:Protein of unknown function (DUF3558)
MIADSEARKRSWKMVILHVIPRTTAAFVLLAAGLVACGGTPPTAALAPTDDAPTAAAPETPAPAPTSAASASREFSTINVCELLPPEEVAELSGGAVDGEPNQQSEADYSMCWYEVTSATGAYSYYIVYLETAEVGEMALTLGETGDPVPDLGDESYLRFEESEDQFRLIVLRRGEYAIDMAGTDSDVMIEIARLLIERLGR